MSVSGVITTTDLNPRSSAYLTYNTIQHEYQFPLDLRIVTEFRITYELNLKLNFINLPSLIVEGGLINGSGWTMWVL